MTYFKRLKQNFCNKTKANGFGLIEVMVALAILSIGALGFIQLELGVSRAEYEAALRISASLLVQDMVDRIQANPAEGILLSSSAYNMSTPYTYTTLSTTSPGTANPYCIGSGNFTCSSAALAAFDIWEWGQYFQTMFPINSTLNIQAVGSGFTITITWPSRQGTTTQQLSGTVLPTPMPTS